MPRPGPDSGCAGSPLPLPGPRSWGPWRRSAANRPLTPWSGPSPCRQRTAVFWRACGGYSSGWSAGDVLGRPSRRRTSVPSRGQWPTRWRAGPSGSRPCAAAGRLPALLGGQVHAEAGKIGVAEDRRVVDPAPDPRAPPQEGLLRAQRDVGDIPGEALVDTAPHLGRPGRIDHGIGRVNSPVHRVALVVAVVPAVGCG